MIPEKSKSNTDQRDALTVLRALVLAWSNPEKVGIWQFGNMMQDAAQWLKEHHEREKSRAAAAGGSQPADDRG